MNLLLLFSTIMWSFASPTSPLGTAGSSGPGEKKLLYCDYNSGRVTLYMDLYLDYNANQKIFTNPEAAVFDAAQTPKYPGYLWSLFVSYDPANAESKITMSKGPENNIVFLVPATDEGLILPYDQKTITPFSITAEGLYNGQKLHSAPFFCYNVYNNPLAVP